MAKISVGLEIGTASVKAVELIHKKNGYKLRKLVKVDIPSPEKGIEREVRTVEVIRDLVHKYKINTKRVVSGIGGESVIVRRIRIPLMKEAEIEQAMRWQAEEYIPYPVDQVCLGFHVLDKGLRGEKGEEISVMLVGAKKETIDERFGLLRKAGISPQIMDVNTLALFNIFQLSNSQGMDGIALLEIGYNTTSIVLLDKSSPFLIRDINLGGFHITQTIAKELNVSYKAAQEMKEKYGIMIDYAEKTSSNGEIELRETDEKAPKESLVDRTVRKSMATLVEEVLHSFEYYTSQREGARIKKVIFSGGSSCLKNIDKFLSEELGVPVEIINPFTGISCDSTRFRPEHLARVGPIFAVSLGLALRRIKKI